VVLVFESDNACDAGAQNNRSLIKLARSQSAFVAIERQPRPKNCSTMATLLDCDAEAEKEKIDFATLSSRPGQSSFQLTQTQATVVAALNAFMADPTQHLLQISAAPNCGVTTALFEWMLYGSHGDATFAYVSSTGFRRSGDLATRHLRKNESFQLRQFFYGAPERVIYVLDEHDHERAILFTGMLLRKLDAMLERICGFEVIIFDKIKCPFDFNLLTNSRELQYLRDHQKVVLVFEADPKKGHRHWGDD
jgi:hypothetical protein